jgi:UDP-N-acetylglucosamine 4,6-dehydratase/5-epimerase
VFENSAILITGGTGSWGQELTRQLLLHNPKKVAIFSRNESSQVNLKRELNDPKISFCIGDVRDSDALVKACEGIDYIFHLAALKHVPVCEEQPLEALKTNVLGTKNVIDAAIANRVKKVINISTDKAAHPVNFYGMTKAIGEKLIIDANMQDVATRFVNVRGGNILGSSGSVLQLFINQLKEKSPIRITDKRMMRFFMTAQSATELLLTAAREGKGGEIFVLKMKACKISDLAEMLMEAYGILDAKMIETGSRPGEKLSEVLLSPFEASHSVILHDRYIVVLPTVDMPVLNHTYAHCPSIRTEYLMSEDLLMTKEEIKQMLNEGGFLPDGKWEGDESHP